MAFAGGWWLAKSGRLQITLTPSPTIEATPVVAPTPAPTPMPSPTPKEETKSDLEQIKEAFAKKYSKPINEVSVTINKNTGTHASGSVKFTGEMGGAMWLAYNDGEKWKIVFDGQGTISCSVIEPYDFPTDMVSECWDEATSKLIKRS